MLLKTSYNTNLSGTSPGQRDIAAFKDVGLTDHAVISNLNMSSGYLYFGTVKGNY